MGRDDVTLLGLSLRDLLPSSVPVPPPREVPDPKLRFYLHESRNQSEEEPCMTLWTSGLLEALRRHPSRTDNVSEARLVLTDQETAFEMNWPNYGKGWATSWWIDAGWVVPCQADGIW